MAAADLTLVTGGTGSLGLPLVEALAREGSQLVVLARKSGPPALPAVRYVHGDIRRGDTLGLADADAASLRQRVGTIVHAAALTRFDAAPDAARAVNVGGTRHVLEFAARCRHEPRVCALSTVYVAGRRTGTILEAELEHACGFVNPYEESKYEAEQLLRDWMERLPIVVCRLGTILGDAQHGRVHRPAAIHQAIRFLYHSLLPMIPGGPRSPVDLIPTEYAVAAISHLSGAGFAPGRTFHVSAGHEAPGEQEVIDLVIDAFLRYRPAWRRRAIEPPAIVELETFELFRQSVEAVADSALRASVAVLGHFAPQLAFPKVFDDAACRAALAPQAIDRPPVGQTIQAVVRYLIEHNWGAGLAPYGQGAGR